MDVSLMYVGVRGRIKLRLGKVVSIVEMESTESSS